MGKSCKFFIDQAGKFSKIHSKILNNTTKKTVKLIEKIKLSLTKVNHTLLNLIRLSVLIFNQSSRQNFQKYTQKYWMIYLEKRFIDWKNQTSFYQYEQYTLKLDSFNRVYFEMIRPSKISKIHSKILNYIPRKTFYYLKKPIFLQPKWTIHF